MSEGITAESVVARAIADAIRPDPPLSVWKWADEYRMLSSKAASAPGKYRSERTPYLREIMDCLSVESPVRKVVVKKPAQVGFSEALNNWIGYVIHHAPGPMLLVQPTVDLCKRYLRDQRLGGVVMSIVQMLLTGNGYTPGSQTYSTAGSYSWTCPAGVTSVTIECIGGGGRGFLYEYGTSNGGGGGGGGGYAKSVRSVTPGSSYSLYVGANEEDSWFISTATVLGTAGGRGQLNGGGTGGSGSGGTGFQLAYSGGTGGAKSSDYYNYYGGGGGGGASASGAGSAGSNQTAGSGGGGGPNGNGGAGGSCDFGNSSGYSGAQGTSPGGGGGGRSSGDYYNNLSLSGGSGAAGQIKITW